MRMKPLIPLAAAFVLVAACVGSSQASPPSDALKPAIAAKQKQAAQVLNEISSIDESLNTTSEQYDGARVRLAAVRKNLHAEEASLVRARARYRRAEARAAKLLVWLYTSSHSNALDVILGASNLGEMLRLSDAEDAIGKQTAAITRETQSAKEQLQARVRALAADRSEAQQTVDELAAQRAEILRGLAKRRHLLASVQSEVTKLEAQERARQARLAAEARARLAAELAARQKAEAAAAAEAAARAKAAAAAAAREQAAAAAAAAAKRQAASAALQASAADTTTPAPPPAATTDTTATATVPAVPAVTTPVPGITTTPSSPAFSGPLPAGHPETAQLALAYLGVPYLWGGESPSGFDCSGLVSYVYAQIGITLPHFAAAQWDYGVPVPVAQLQPGDLVFFAALDHVGIYLGNNEFINAPHTGSFVRIDTLDEPWYAKHYVGARRI